MIKLIIFILYCMTLVQLQSLYRYEVIIDHLELPEKDDLFDYGTIRVKKFNRTTYTAIGYCDILIPFSDDIVGHLTVFAYQGNEYRKVADKTIDKMCTAFRDDKLFVPRVKHQTSFANKTINCPVEPQRIHFYDINLPADYLPFTPPSAEKYRLNTVYSLNDKVLSNFSTYFSLKKIDEGFGGFSG